MTDVNRMVTFSADRPLGADQVDRFQRKDLAKRLVRLIKGRRKEDCLVVGLYGSWGEGKTSVIDMLDMMLSQENLATTYRFNPWTYKDENTLLKEFFLGLAESMEQDLLTPKDKVADALRRYGDAFNFIPYGGLFSTFTKTIKEVSIESLKGKLANGLRAYQKPIVVFLDDIDRLNKDELHAVFRLVKLTGDLPNVTYVLCFDDEMVAAAIGDRFGQGGLAAGRDFLEKVIQVPIRLPRIPIEGECGLKTFALEEVQKVLTGCAVVMSEEMVNEFRREFIGAIVPAISTPREVIRYANALSFTLPMLHGEVNTVDLMLFEAIRVFYPGHHKFISDEREMFLVSFKKPFEDGLDQDKIDRFKERMDKLDKGLSNRATDGVKKLVEHLFPRTSEAFNPRSYLGAPWKQWYKEQRITDPYYFQRYISYTVPKGELQDVQLMLELSRIREEHSNASEAVDRLVKQSSPREFLRKLDARIPEIDHPTALQVAKAIMDNAGLFPEEFNFLNLGYDSPRRLAADAVVKMVESLPRQEHSDELISLVDSCKDLEMAMAIELELGEQVHRQNMQSDLLVSVQSKLREKALKEANGRPLFVAFPVFAKRLLYHWAESDPNSVQAYVNDVFRSSRTGAIDLLRALAPLTRSTSHPEPYLVDFTKNYYDQCAAYCDIKLLAEKLQEAVGLEHDINASPLWVHNEPGQTDVNIARQFMYWHNGGEPTVE